jgi:hypothetical protein
MKTALVSIIGLATAGAAAIALGVVALLPGPAPAQQIWVDAPLDSATISAGSTSVIVHLNPVRPPSTVRVVVRSAAGSDVAVVSQDATTATTTGSTGNSLYMATLDWSATPGVYTLIPRYLEDGTWTTGTPERVTVIGSVSAPPVPTASPTSAPTSSPGPTAPATSASPTASPTAPAVVTLYATIAMIAGSLDANSNYISTYRVSAIVPSAAEVDVQWQRVNDGTTAGSTWSDVSCGPQTADPQSATPASTCTATVDSGVPKNNGYTVNYRVTVDDGTDPVFTSATQSFHVKAVTIIH